MSELEVAALEGDGGAEVAAVLAAHVYAGWGACSCGWKRDNLDSPRHREHQAERLAPLIAARVEAAKAEALAPIEAHRAWLEGERDTIRAAYRAHNAGRAEGRPAKRPDLDTWANAYEVAERHLRAALDPGAP